MISVSEMQALEDASGISKLTLMENAGRAVAEIISQKYDLKGKRILVVAYHGNNGGDGFVAARHLADKAEVEVLFLGEESKLKPEAEENLRKIENDPTIQFIGLEFVDFAEYDIIIDAIVGTGVLGQLKPIIQSTVDKMNQSKAVKVSVDVPTGLNPDTGAVDDRRIDAELIITLHDTKAGLKDMKDNVVIADIGIQAKEL